MQPGHRGLLTAIGVVVVVGAMVSAVLLWSVVSAWTTLPIPAGTTITDAQTGTWVAHFTVGPGGGVLVGAWTAYTVSGDIGPVIVNGTVSKPQPPPGIYNCPMEMFQEQANGTLDRVLAPGPYTMYWSPLCTSAREIVVTQTIQVTAA